MWERGLTYSKDFKLGSRVLEHVGLWVCEGFSEKLNGYYHVMSRESGVRSRGVYGSWLKVPVEVWWARGALLQGWLWVISTVPMCSILFLVHHKQTLPYLASHFNGSYLTHQDTAKSTKRTAFLSILMTAFGSFGSLEVTFQCY